MKIIKTLDSIILKDNLENMKKIDDMKVTNRRSQRTVFEELQEPEVIK